MKKSSFKYRKKEDDMHLPDRVLRFKKKGIIYKIDWNISAAQELLIALPADLKILNFKNDIT